MIAAICSELSLRKDELKTEINTIYFGGGTPSLLTSEELESIFKTVYSTYKVSEDAEITLEANPDDLSEAIIKELSKSRINRLSIGVQSFFEEDLKLMNRAHNTSEAINCITIAKKYFNNISIDLIYGIPGMSNARWTENLKKAFVLNVPHLSCYALTVEPKTALESFIKKGIVPPVEDAIAEAHYKSLLEMTAKEGFENYEFSNFGKQGYYSKNNTAYWEGKPYLGVGPSAHSYDGSRRSWNVANNAKYIKAIDTGILPIEREQLSETDKYNEYIMTGLRTKRGVSLDKIESDFGPVFRENTLEMAKIDLEEGFLILRENSLFVTTKGKFLSDGIASRLFLVNLET